MTDPFADTTLTRVDGPDGPELLAVIHDVQDRVEAVAAVAAARERLALAGRLAYDAVFEWHVADKRIVWHSAVDRLLGLPEGTISEGEDDWLGRIRPEDQAAMQEALSHHRQATDPIDYEYRIAHADGTWREWRDRALPVLDATGQPTRWVGVCTDVTELRRVEVAEEQRAERLRLSADVFEQVSDGIVVVTPEGGIEEVNPAFCAMTGYDRAALIGGNSAMLMAHEQRPAWLRGLRRLRAGDSLEGEVWARRRSGAAFPARVTISPVQDEGGRIERIVGLVTDISQQKAHERDLEYSAQHDPLTGLPNRVLLADRMDQAMARADRRGSSMAVAYLDLDQFKPVNDALGHAAGDTLLQVIANRFEAVIRRHDTVARLGGDEFCFVVTDLADPRGCEPIPAAVSRS